jgi:hypothetical protein
VLTQKETVSVNEEWADLQYHKVLNYLTEERIYTYGSLRLIWLGAPYLALYHGLIYERDGGPIWVLHTIEKTGCLKAPRTRPPREIIKAFSILWKKEEDPVSRKWSKTLTGMALDSDLW